MQMQMYSRKEFDVSMRTSFILNGDPYHPSCEEARTQLRLMGVVFYRDERHTDGLVIDEVALTERGFEAWKHAAIVNDFAEKKGDKVKVQVIAWPDPRKDYVESKGDDRAWLQFNVPVRIASLTREIVQLA